MHYFLRFLNLLYLFFFLYISEPITEIVGGPDLYISEGGVVNLTCILKHSPEPPAAIIWSHEHRVSYYQKKTINYKNIRKLMDNIKKNSFVK